MSGLAGIIGLGIIIVPLLHPPKAPADSELERTPSLGLEVWQDNKRVSMMNNTRNNGDYVNRITIIMQSKPFEIHMPKLTDKLDIKINAWKDDSLFNVRAGTNPDGPPYTSIFASGKGHVDDVRASARLFLTTDTYTDFSPERSDSIAGDKSSIYFSQVDDPPVPTPGPATVDPWSFPARVYMPDSKSLHKLTDWHQNLYLLVWRDDNQNKIIDSEEYEYITLQFPPKAKP